MFQIIGSVADSIFCKLTLDVSFPEETSEPGQEIPQKSSQHIEEGNCN